MIFIHIHDLRHLLKPSHGRPGPQGRARPHYSEDPVKGAERASARRDGGIKRIVLHQWGTRVTLSKMGLVASAVGDWERGVNRTRQLAYRAAGLDHEGNPLPRGGAPYHVSCGCTVDGIGMVAIVWPREVHTFHAEEENAESIGVGVMGKFPGLVDAPQARGFGLALRHALAIARLMVLDEFSPPYDARGSIVSATRLEPDFANDTEVELRTHSQTQAKPADPGLWAIKTGVFDLVQRGALCVDPLYHTGKGQPWPREWREVVGRA